METEASDGIEPGQPIGECTCPCCGASLEIEHGDEEGQIAVCATTFLPWKRRGED